MKKKLSRFFTLSRRHDAGFTLVELIVVIAILGILAGVGTVGYSGYIKNANKNADKTNVGNIMRAIETGYYSYTFDMEQVQMEGASIEYPVGFVVMTEEGVKAYQSNTSRTPHTVTSSCKLWNDMTEDEKNAWISSLGTVYNDFGAATTNATYSLGCATYLYTGVIFNSELPTVTRDYYNSLGNICTTHSTIADTDTIRFTPYTCEHYLAGNHTKHRTEKTGKLLSEFSFQIAHTGEDLTYDKFGEFSVTNTGVLHDALVAAFGDNYSEAAKLKYDGWTVQNEATVNQHMSDVWAHIKKLLQDNMTILNSFLGGLVEDAFSQKYNSTTEMLVSVSQTVSTVDKETFLSKWMTVDTAYSIPCNATFGYAGRENYASMRQAYNENFAAYMMEHGSDSNHTDSSTSGTHIYSILNYKSITQVPLAVCQKALEGTLADDYNTLPTAMHGCTECLQLYEDYLKGGDESPCYANGAATYDLLKTVADTGDKVAEVMTEEEDFFGYYENYLKEFNGMYTTINNAAGTESAIVIAVYVNTETGVMTCEVLTEGANPRN